MLLMHLINGGQSSTHTHTHTHTHRLVSSQLDLLVTQLVSGLLNPRSSALLPGLRPQLGTLLACLMQQDSKVGRSEMELFLVSYLFD